MGEAVSEPGVEKKEQRHRLKSEGKTNAVCLMEAQYDLLKDCPRRSALCHGTCQRYLKAHIRHILLAKRAERRASDARAFYAEESTRVAWKKKWWRYGDKE